MASQIFRKESIDKVSSPEQLNNYIRVSGVSVWIIIIAAIVLLAAVFVWSVVGSLETEVSTVGIAENGVISCYIEDVDSLVSGNTVKLPDGGKSAVGEISEKPVSKAELEEKYDDYVIYSLDLPEWSYCVKLDAPDVANGIVEIRIVTDSVSPISFILD